MAEINNRNSQFDIVIEGIKRFDDVQIVGSRDGKRNANYDLTFDEVDVSDGELNLEFPGSASVAGIIIRDSATTSSWDLMWSDEFDIDGAIDPTKWTHENWAPGNVNNELQRYTSRPENSRVEGGNLIIEARRDFYQEMNIPRPEFILEVRATYSMVVLRCERNYLLVEVRGPRSG